MTQCEVGTCLFEVVGAAWLQAWRVPIGQASKGLSGVLFFGLGCGAIDWDWIDGESRRTGKSFSSTAFPPSARLSHWRGSATRGWRTGPARYAARPKRVTVDTRCSRRPSPFRPMPSCCTRPSRGAYVDKGYRGHDAQIPVVSSSPAETRRRCHQARAAPPLRHRAHHRTPEGRRSPRPLLPQRPRRRCRQRPQPWATTSAASSPGQNPTPPCRA